MNAECTDSPLHDAPRTGDVDRVWDLIQAGTDVSAKDTNDCTPLLLATLRGRGDVVELLHARGADPDTSNRKGETVLSLAASAGELKICEALLKAGADGETHDHYGGFPILYAS
jgi:ankyrin repeat protein